jgi:hypothetical protein
MVVLIVASKFYSKSLETMNSEVQTSGLQICALFCFNCDLIAARWASLRTFEIQRFKRNFFHSSAAVLRKAVFFHPLRPLFATPLLARALPEHLTVGIAAGSHLVLCVPPCTTRVSCTTITTPSPETTITSQSTIIFWTMRREYTVWIFLVQNFRWKKIAELVYI